MPLHAVQQGDKPIEALDAAIKALERKGETVLSTQSFANQWVILTQKPQKVETRQDRETR